MKGYAADVRMMIAKIVLLVAVLLMPFGMSPSVASSARHADAQTTAMQHCPDQSRHGLTGGIAECTMSCAAALPAVDPPIITPITAERLAVEPLTQKRLRGLRPETVTPPPRFA